jgi:hypothetical protein
MIVPVTSGWLTLGLLDYYRAQRWLRAGRCSDRPAGCCIAVTWAINVAWEDAVNLLACRLLWPGFCQRLPYSSGCRAGQLSEEAQPVGHYHCIWDLL